jgi:hypothetical protein
VFSPLRALLTAIVRGKPVRFCGLEACPRAVTARLDGLSRRLFHGVHALLRDETYGRFRPS